MNTKAPLIKWGWVRAILYFVLIAGGSFAAQLLSQPLEGLIKLWGYGALANFVLFVITYTITTILVFVITWLCMKFIDRLQFQELGFGLKEYSNEAGIGFFTAVFLLGLGTLILISTHHLTINGAKFDFKPFGLQFLLMILVAFNEEVIFRGYVLRNLMQSVNKWVALLISALLFALVHLGNPDITVIAVVNVFLAGLLLGINYVYTRNLWFGIVLHFTWNFMQGAILGYDVSGFKLPGIFSQTLFGPVYITGGEFGFEGSVVCTALLLVATVVFYVVFEKRYVTNAKPIVAVNAVFS